MTEDQLQVRIAAETTSVATNLPHLTDDFLKAGGVVTGQVLGEIPHDPQAANEASLYAWMRDEKNPDGVLVGLQATLAASGENGSFDNKTYLDVAMAGRIKSLLRDAEIQSIKSRAELLTAQGTINTEEDKLGAETLGRSLRERDAIFIQSILSKTVLDAAPEGIQAQLNGLHQSRDAFRAVAEENGRRAGIDDSEFWDVNTLTPGHDRLIARLEGIMASFKTVNEAEEAWQSKNFRQTLIDLGFNYPVSDNIMVDQAVAAQLSPLMPEVLAALKRTPSAVLDPKNFDFEKQAFSNGFLAIVDGMTPTQATDAFRAASGMSSLDGGTIVEEAQVMDQREQLSTLKIAALKVAGTQGPMGKSALDEFFDLGFVTFWNKTMGISAEDDVARGLGDAVKRTLKDTRSYNTSLIETAFNDGIRESFPGVRLIRPVAPNAPWTLSFGDKTGPTTRFVSGEILKSAMEAEGLPMTIEGLRKFVATYPTATSVEATTDRRRYSAEAQRSVSLLGEKRTRGLSIAKELLTKLDKPLKLINQVEALTGELGIDSALSFELPNTDPGSVPPSSQVSPSGYTRVGELIIISNEEGMEEYAKLPVGTSVFFLNEEGGYTPHKKTKEEVEGQ
jgi:hypothetical protein